MSIDTLQPAAQPVAWHPRPAPGDVPAVPSDVPEPAFKSVTLMLTEFCNLDCWMCDFGRSKGLREAIDWTPAQFVQFLRHPYFKGLNSVGFTGGEPFAFAGVGPLYEAVQAHFPEAFVSFSTNATLLKPMSETYALTRNWKRTRLITSIDGVAAHDVQRGEPGAFDKSMRHLHAMRRRFPELGIDVKFTITPLTCHELREAYVHCTDRGFNFTAKMLENNPYYTNKLSAEAHAQDFRFAPGQIEQVRAQLDWILSHASRSLTRARLQEMQELRASLDPAWRRAGCCSAPTESLFLDSRLNVFCCKEYPPLLNLHTAALDDLPATPLYRQVFGYERANSHACTRCTSQLKRYKPRPLWARWFG